MAGDGGDEVKSLCDKWCIYRFLDGKERLCKATERYKKTVQPVLQCDKYKRFLDSDRENMLEAELAAANQHIAELEEHLKKQDELHQIARTNFHRLIVNEGNRNRRLKKVADAAREIRLNCSFSDNPDEYCFGCKSWLTCKALAELEAK
jgi:hypothetical protein